MASHLEARQVAPALPSDEHGNQTIGTAAIAGRYEILGLLGVGGMGTVYKARDRELDEMVALKVLRRELVETPGMLDRFRREVKLARRVTHPNVARTFDIGEHEGEKFLTMELIDGKPLSAVLARETVMSLARVAQLLKPLCAGLTAAHAAGVVHRDLKPDNVLIGDDGRVAITDFGIARAHLEGGAARTRDMMSGTPAYMAPEQVEIARDVDARTDIYALGAILFELFTGERAWPGDSPIGVAAARLVHPPPDPRLRGRRVSDGVAALIMRCMATAPADRFASVPEVSAELDRLLDQQDASLPSEAVPSIGPALRANPLSLTPAASASHKTVAVLPFRNSGPPQDDYLASGLTDDLIDTLSMTRGLRVRSRGVVLGLHATDRDPREIGRELDVQVVVEGSVRRMGDQVRISARVSSVANGFQLWAKRFERPAEDLLVVGDEVARAIAEALTVDHDAPSRDVPDDPVAIDLYLRARSESKKFRRVHAENALGLYQQALARAPGDPMILAGCAMSAARLWFFGGEGAFEAGVLARDLAERAAASAPRLGEARLALALVRFHGGDLPGAVREARQALASAPGNADVHALLGRIQLEVGPLEEGIRRSETALALDPTLVSLRGELARGYALAGQWEKTKAYMETDSSEPMVWVARARYTSWLRDKPLALRYLRELSETGALSGNLTARAFLQATADGRALDIDPAFQAALVPTGAGPRRLTFFQQMKAEAALAVGRREQALQAIEAAAAGGLADFMWLEHCPLLDELRTEQRFMTVRATIEERQKRVLEALA